MAEIAAPAPRRAAGFDAGLALLALAAAASAARLFGDGAVPGVQNFLLVFGSLLIEAVPFILLGALVSALIEVFVPTRWFRRGEWNREPPRCGSTSGGPSEGFTGRVCAGITSPSPCCGGGDPIVGSPVATRGCPSCPRLSGRAVARAA